MAWWEHPRRAPLLAIGALALWLLALAAAPLSLAPGTVVGLEGRENSLDHAPLWLSLPPLQGAVYAVGDAMCHQKAWRSFALGGNQLPIDERMTAIFAAALPGLLLTLRTPITRYVGLSLEALLPERARRPDARAAARRWTLLVTLALLPAAVDVLWENAWGRESTTALRVLTGALAGVAGGLVLGALLANADAVLTAWRRGRARSRAGP